MSGSVIKLGPRLSLSFSPPSCSDSVPRRVAVRKGRGGREAAGGGAERAGTVKDAAGGRVGEGGGEGGAGVKGPKAWVNAARHGDT